MLEHISLLNLKFLMLLYSHQHVINFCTWILLFFLFAAYVLFYDLSHKNSCITSITLLTNCSLVFGISEN